MTLAQCESSTKRRGYLEWHAFAEARHKVGERQVKCTLCNRYRFKEERCADFTAASETTITRREALR